ncbi:MAG TPA: LptA/OstA family protein, partial [Vicinamibacterales bacterium]|nr:LptA/OstA family protein [Vicinamibacterales bacterium]
MSADAIDLLYVEGGETLDRVTLTGNAAAALTGKKNDGTTQGGRRQLVGGVLDMQLAPDGTLVHAGAREGVRFDLPATDKARGSSIQARTFDANGTAGAGLTSAAFVDDVVFREDGEAGAAARTARSRTLDLSLDHDEVTTAMFRGAVSFEDRGLAACAAQVRYAPQPGSLSLTGADAGGGPRASDDQVAIAADSIDVALQNTQIDARGGVKTVLRPPRQARGNCLPRAESKDAARSDAKDGKLPGLLKEGAPVNVNADRLGYEGTGGAATYVGNASLWQGDTSIRADELRLDQSKGDLLASGGARATLIVAGETSVGHGDVIRYEDAKHLVSYESRKPPPARGRAAAASPAIPTAPAGGRNTQARGAAPGRGAAARGTPAASVPAGPTPAYLKGPQGELRAWRIDMILTADAAKADRMEAFDTVSLQVARATGERLRATGDQLTYFAEGERYVMTGSATAPVCVVDPNRASTGKTLVFYRSTDKVLVDGNEQARTQTKSGGACAVSPAR